VDTHSNANPTVDISRHTREVVIYDSLPDQITAEHPPWIVLAITIAQKGLTNISKTRDPVITRVARTSGDLRNGYL